MLQWYLSCTFSEFTPFNTLLLLNISTQQMTTRCKILSTADSNCQRTYYCLQKQQKLTLLHANRNHVKNLVTIELIEPVEASPIEERSLSVYYFASEKFIIRINHIFIVSIDMLHSLQAFVFSKLGFRVRLHVLS